MKQKILFLIQIVENGKIENPNKHIHDYPLSWLCTGTSIISVCGGGGIGFEGGLSGLISFMSPTLYDFPVLA
jgi:hypothetical protein